MIRCAINLTLPPRHGPHLTHLINPSSVGYSEVQEIAVELNGEQTGIVLLEEEESVDTGDPRASPGLRSTLCGLWGKSLTLSGPVCSSAKIMGLDQLSSEGPDTLALRDLCAQMGKQLRIMYSCRLALQGPHH